ncbi:MAG: hypothetical protein ACRC5C_03960, partial [Bacilli bacterium]
MDNKKIVLSDEIKKLSFKKRNLSRDLYSEPDYDMNWLSHSGSEGENTIFPGEEETLAIQFSKRDSKLSDNELKVKWDREKALALLTLRDQSTGEKISSTLSIFEKDRMSFLLGKNEDETEIYIGEQKISKVNAKNKTKIEVKKRKDWVSALHLKEMNLGNLIAPLSFDFFYQAKSNERVKVYIGEYILLEEVTTETGRMILGHVELQNIWDELLKGEYSIIFELYSGSNRIDQKIVPFKKIVGNSAPSITGTDTDLGVVDEQTNYVYQIKDAEVNPEEGDKVTVQYILNGEVVREIENSPIDVDVVISFDDYYKQLVIGSNTLQIKATDSYGIYTIRTLLCERVNRLPIILVNEELSDTYNNPFGFSFSAYDPDEKGVVVELSLNGERLPDQYGFTINGELDFTESWENIPLGGNEFLIVALDSNGGRSEKHIIFEKVNNAPTIVTDAEPINELWRPQTYNVRVSDENIFDTVHLEVFLNDEIIFENLDAKDRDLTFDIDESILHFEIGDYPFVLKATDDKGNVTVLDYIVRKIPEPNFPPTISGEDTDLGIKNKLFEYSYTIFDVNTNEVVTAREYIDNDLKRVIRKFPINKALVFNLEDYWPSLKNGEHSIKIVAEDSRQAQAVRNLTFTKDVDVTKPPELETPDLLSAMASPFTYDYFVRDNLDRNLE